MQDNHRILTEIEVEQRAQKCAAEMLDFVTLKPLNTSLVPNRVSNNGVDVFTYHNPEPSPKKKVATTN